MNIPFLLLVLQFTSGASFNEVPMYEEQSNFMYSEFEVDAEILDLFYITGAMNCNFYSKSIIYYHPTSDRYFIGMGMRLKHLEFGFSHFCEHPEAIYGEYEIPSHEGSQETYHLSVFNTFSPTKNFQIHLKGELGINKIFYEYKDRKTEKHYTPYLLSEVNVSFWDTINFGNELIIKRTYNSETAILYKFNCSITIVDGLEIGYQGYINNNIEGFYSYDVDQNGQYTGPFIKCKVSM